MSRGTVQDRIVQAAAAGAGTLLLGLTTGEMARLSVDSAPGTRCVARSVSRSVVRATLDSCPVHIRSVTVTRPLGVFRLH